MRIYNYDTSTQLLRDPIIYISLCTTKPFTNELEPGFKEIKINKPDLIRSQLESKKTYLTSLGLDLGHFNASQYRKS